MTLHYSGPVSLTPVLHQFPTFRCPDKYLVAEEIRGYDRYGCHRWSTWQFKFAHTLFAQEEAEHAHPTEVCVSTPQSGKAREVQPPLRVDDRIRQLRTCAGQRSLAKKEVVLQAILIAFRVTQEVIANSYQPAHVLPEMHDRPRLHFCNPYTEPP